MITKEDEIKPIIVEPQVEDTALTEVVPQEAEAPKKSRRPNRGGTKTKRQPRKRKNEEATVE